MRHALAAPLAGLALMAAASSPRAQEGAVQVGLGPAVQARLGDLGRTDLAEQQAYLRNAVQRALARGPLAGSRVQLVIADIEPNQPTSSQLGASTQLNLNSPGEGGVAVTGEATTADGRRLPIRFRFFQDQIRNEVNFTTWGDADQAFDDLATALGHGQTPDQTGAWPPPHRARAVTGTRIPG